MSRLQLLLIEDSQEDADLILRELARGGYEPDCRRVETNAAIAAALDSGKWDLIISDFFVPQVAVIETLALVRRRGLDAPFLVVSSKMSDEDAVSVMRAGADDIIGKDKLWRLVPALEREFDETRLRREHRHISQRFRALFEHNIDAICLIDASATILSASPSTEQVLGYKPEELVGRNGLHLVYLEDRPLIEKRLRMLVENPRLHITIQTRVQHENGDIRWVEAVGTNLLADHEVGSIVVNFRDITEQKQAEQKLIASERRFRALIENSSDGVLLLNADGTILLAGPPILGYQNQEWVGRKGFDLIHPDDRPPVLAQFSDIITRPGDAVTSHYRARNRVGSWRWIEAVTKNLIEDPDVQAIVVNYRDITGRKRTEEDLRQQAQLLDLAHDAIMAIRLDGTIEFWNRGAEQMYGWSRDEAIGKISHALLRTEFPEPLGDLEAKLEKQGHWEGQLVHTTRASSRLTMMSRWALRRDASGQPSGFLEIDTDITERKRFEAEMLQTQKLESLGVLAGGVAHDFNNLLTGILGNASLALDRLPDRNPVYSMLNEIVRAGQRAADLTRQLLAYAGKGRFITHALDLSEVVREISVLIQASIPKNVQLRLELAQDLPAVEADPGQFQQVIMNLVINGAEAIAPGQAGTVLVTTAVQHIDYAHADTHFAAGQIGPGDYVRLEVQDTGVGMDAATQLKIFDPFFSTKFSGRGLGLSAVLGIVRGHKGALRLYSRPGKGSTFQILFPAVSKPAERSAEASLPDDLEGSGLVLVVDDEASVRDVATNTLERYGYTVIPVENGKGAIEVFKQRSGEVTMVLLDLTMPVLSGEETLRQMQAIRADVPVLLSSGFNEVEAVQRFVGKGLAGFIQKPYTAATLAQKVKAAIISHRSDGAN